MKPEVDRRFGKAAIAIAVVLVVGGLVALAPLTWNKYKWSRVDALRGAATGMTRDEVDRKFGEPFEEYSGVYSNEIDRVAHPNSLTCVYRLVGGEFYVCFDPANPGWKAFASDFLPDRAAF